VAFINVWPNKKILVIFYVAEYEFEMLCAALHMFTEKKYVAPYVHVFSILDYYSIYCKLPVKRLIIT
jgi:hypothetical protein